MIPSLAAPVGRPQRTNYFCTFPVRCHLWRSDGYCNWYGVVVVAREE